MRQLKIEINSNLLKEKGKISTEHGYIFITPPLDEDYWVLRCKVSPKQAILVFPKFLTFSCGFAKEKDWNLNLPIVCSEEKIWNHIKRNRAAANIEICKQALHLLRETAKNLGLFDEEMETRFRNCMLKR